MTQMNGRSVSTTSRRISAVTICQILFPIDKRYDKSKLSRYTIRYDNSIMITIGSNAFCCCRSNRSNRYTCPLHCLTLCCPPVRRGDIKVKYSPSSRRLQTMDVYQWCANPGILNPYFVHPPFCIHADVRVRNYTFHRYVVTLNWISRIL